MSVVTWRSFGLDLNVLDTGAMRHFDIIILYILVQDIYTMHWVLLFLVVIFCVYCHLLWIEAIYPCTPERIRVDQFGIRGGGGG